MRCALRGGDAASQHPRRRVVRQFHDVEHQRRGFIARIVGAMPEEHARAPQAPFDACDQLARGAPAALDVE